MSRPLQMKFTRIGMLVAAMIVCTAAVFAQGNPYRLADGWAQLPANIKLGAVISVDVDAKAKVVVNERTGTVIIGSEVTISPVSISHGNLSISIETQFNVSQPQPLAPGGQTVVVPEQKVTAQEQKSSFVTLGRGATVDDLIRSLNALGVTPRDTIAILEALKTAGALQAELEIL